MIHDPGIPRNSELEVSLVDTDVARVVNGNKEGYIVRTQEVFSGVFHDLDLL